MTLTDITKQAFATALEAMLAEMPLRQVRVTALARRCHTSPQTFYYHFHDKYELVAWIFTQDYARVARCEVNPETIATMMTTMAAHKQFYRQALIDDSQNAIADYIHQFDVATATAAALASLHVQHLSASQTLAISYHAYGVIGLFKDWLFDRLPQDVATLAQFQYQQLPDFLKAAYKAQK